MELKLSVNTTEANGHTHALELPDGEIEAGTYRTGPPSGEDDGHTHSVVLEADLEPGDAARVRTSEAEGHTHGVVVRAGREEGTSDEDEDEERRRDEDEKCRPEFETKRVRGQLLEVKQGERNGVPVGFVTGYIATWDVDTGGVFGVPDRFERGAFTASLENHRRRGNRPVRLKDHHGRTIGAFPLETVREDDIGLFGMGEINLEIQQGREAFSLARQGVLSDFSVGFRALSDRLEDGIRVIEEAELFEGSIVDEPANQAARILEVKTVVPFQDLPLADGDRPWDSRAAIRRIREFTDSQEAPSRDYRRAFLFFESGQAGNFGAYKLPIADVIDGRLTAVPRAISAAAGALRGARGGVDIPDTERPRVIRHLERYFAKLDRPSPFDRDERQFWGWVEAKEFSRRDFETALIATGFFSKGAAKALAARLAEPETSRYSLDGILQSLQECASL